MWTHTRESQQSITPELALAYLKDGNQRFLQNLKVNRNLLMQVNQTSEGQFPFAAILSCIDSRTSAELIFDQGLGDIFSIRIAGNILNDDILGSLEYACKVANSKLIVVLGHNKCGAITSACANVKMGHLTGLLDKLRPAIDMGKRSVEQYNGCTADFLSKVSLYNVQLNIRQIRERSSILNEMEQQGLIGIVGGFYDLDTGAVTFFPDGEPGFK